jgi:hypothetical protein
MEITFRRGVKRAPYPLYFLPLTYSAPQKEGISMPRGVGMD